MSQLIRPPKCATHGNIACRYCTGVTDAGKRISTLVNNMVAFRGWDELQDGYMAFKLEDGDSPDHCTLYDSYESALAHTDETRCAYFCFRQAMGGISPHDAEIWLMYNRAVVAAGVPRRVPDARRREAPVLPILPIAAYDKIKGRRR